MRYSSGAAILANHVCTARRLSHLLLLRRQQLTETALGPQPNLARLTLGLGVAGRPSGVTPSTSPTGSSAIRAEGSTREEPVDRRDACFPASNPRPALSRAFCILANHLSRASPPKYYRMLFFGIRQ